MIQCLYLMSYMVVEKAIQYVLSYYISVNVVCSLNSFFLEYVQLLPQCLFCYFLVALLFFFGLLLFLFLVYLLLLTVGSLLALTDTVVRFLFLEFDILLETAFLFRNMLHFQIPFSNYFMSFWRLYSGQSLLYVVWPSPLYIHVIFSSVCQYGVKIDNLYM